MPRAIRAGQLARRRADYPRAEVWLQRAIVLARRWKNWSAYTLAFLCLGNLHVQAGNLAAARAYHVRALKAAERFRLGRYRGDALHELFRVAADRGRVDEAVALGRLAVEAFGSGHPRLVVLAHDIAFFWIVQGDFARALPVLEATLPRVSAPSERLLVVANVARAAGAVGRRKIFEGAWVSVQEAVRDYGENAPYALLALARGASSLGDWSRAEQAAKQALAAAQERQEALTATEAECILESIQGHLAAEKQAPVQRPDVEANALRDRLIKKLEKVRK